MMPHSGITDSLTITIADVTLMSVPMGERTDPTPSPLSRGILGTEFREDDVGSFPISLGEMSSYKHVRT